MQARHEANDPAGERPYAGPPADAGPGAASEREARLVAHLLGELGPEESAAVAAELARDGELAALAERLGATLGLLRSSARPELGAAAQARLSKAARPARRWPLQLAAAASLLLTVGAAWALLGRDAARSGRPADTRLAQSPPDAAPAKSAQLAQAESAPRAAAARSLDAAGSAPAEAAPESPFNSDQFNHVIGIGGSRAKSDERRARGARSDSGGRATQERPTLTDELRMLAALGYGGGGLPPELAGVAQPLSDSPAQTQPAPAAPGTSLTLGGRELSVGGIAGLGGGAGQGDFKGSTSNYFDAPRTERLGLFDELEGPASQGELPDAAARGEGSPPLAETPLPGGLFMGKGIGSGESAAESRGPVDSAADLARRLGLEPAGLTGLLIGLGYLPGDYAGDLDDGPGRAALQRLIQREQRQNELERLLEDTRRRPGESLDAMFFRQWGTRPFVDTRSDPLSTFAADVDTASYTLCRALLDQGFLPERDAVRPEEFINAFDPAVPAPESGVFALHADLAPSPDDDGEWLLRLVVRAKAVPEAERPPLALHFVVDTSGSMAREGRLELVKSCLRQLASRLDGRDTLSLVAFANGAREVLAPTSGDRRGEIAAAIDSLAASGGTDIESGLVAGYQRAVQSLDRAQQSRVVLLSDGVGNIGETSAEGLLVRVAEARAQGIFLNTIGVGLGNHNDAFLEQLADRGDGLCNYVDDAAEGRRAFVENFTGAFLTVAKDVKIQVEFDPQQVESYRQVGYENRQLADRSFRDDAVDAGEVPAGRTVVALYRLRGLRFSAGGVGAADAARLATLRLRYLPAQTDQDGEGAEGATELELAITPALASADARRAPIGLQRAMAVAQFAELLRRSYFARGTDPRALGAWIQDIAAADPDPEFRDFAALYARHLAAFEGQLQPANPLQATIDALLALRFELERERSAPGTPDAESLAKLESRIAALEAELRNAWLASAPR